MGRPAGRPPATGRGTWNWRCSSASPEAAARRFDGEVVDPHADLAALSRGGRSEGALHRGNPAVEHLGEQLRFPVRLPLDIDVDELDPWSVHSVAVANGLHPNRRGAGRLRGHGVRRCVGAREPRVLRYDRRGSRQRLHHIGGGGPWYRGSIGRLKIVEALARGVSSVEGRNCPSRRNSRTTVALAAIAAVLAATLVLDGIGSDPSVVSAGSTTEAPEACVADGDRAIAVPNVLGLSFEAGITRVERGGLRVSARLHSPARFSEVGGADQNHSSHGYPSP